MGKNKKKIFRKIDLETTNLNYPIAIHTRTIYGKIVKNFAVR